MLSGTDVTDVTDFSVYRHTRAHARARMSVNGMIGNIRPIGNTWAKSAPVPLEETETPFAATNMEDSE